MTDSIIYVNQDSVYKTVTAALDSIPEENKTPITISIAPGIYHEKITINKPYVTLVGEGVSNSDTVLTYDDYALFIMEDGFKRGTFRTYSVFIDAHDVTLKNLTIENASGDSKTHGQALALYADGDRLIIDSCRLLGHQDTLFTAPLPPKEVEPRGFIGPKQNAPRITGRHYYKNCYICGDIDFIFGGATAYFDNCTIESLARTKGASKIATDTEVHGEVEIQGYVTAASTPEGQEYGYVFEHCDFISRDCPSGSVYLGRPWREFAKTVFLNCMIGAHIHNDGFHDWGKTAAHETIYYAEYNSIGNVHPRVSYVHTIPDSDMEKYTKERVLCGKDNWNP